MRRTAAVIVMLAVLPACSGNDAESAQIPRALGFGAGSPAAAQAGVVAADSVTVRTRQIPLDFQALFASHGNAGFSEVSRDGRWLANFNRDTGDLTIVSLATGEVLNLTGNPEPYEPGWAFLPKISWDGEWLVYTWIRWEAGVTLTELQMRRLDGSGDVRTVFAPPPDRWTDPFDWSPDGRTILATENREDGTTDLVLVPVDGSEPRILLNLGWSSPRAARFSPDGHWVAVDFSGRPDTNDRDIHVVAIDGSGGGPIVQDEADDWLLGWSPEGFILFSSDRTGIPGAWRVRVEGGRAIGEPELVKPDLWRIAPLGFHHDGRFFYASWTGSSDIHVASLDPETGRVVGQIQRTVPRSPGGSEGAAWSPDGRHLAYFISKHPFGGGILSDRRLMIRSVETGQARELRMPPGALGIGNASWTRDGRSILVRASYDRGRQTLIRVDARTGRAENVTEDEDLAGYQLLADGRIIHRRPAKGPDGAGAGQRIVLRDLAGGDERELYRQRQPGGAMLGGLALSPDERYLAFVDRSGSEVADLPHELIVLSIADGEGRVVHRGRDFSDIADGAWTATGDALLITRHGEGDPRPTELVRIPLDGGEPETIGRFPDGIYGIRPHPDGSRIAFVTGYATAELWVMENVRPVTARASAADAR